MSEQECNECRLNSDETPQPVEVRSKYPDDDRERIEKVFTYHAPKDDQRGRYIALRDNAKSLAKLIDVCCPKSREKSLAFTKLEEVVMWANAAIARNE